MEEKLKKFLEFKAFQLRYLSIISTSKAGSGHMTSALSCADIISVLFFCAMHFDPKNPENSDNDRFILSKGHAAPILYAVYKELGILKEKDLLTYRDFESVLEGHPTPRFKYVEAATGSLGQGLSIASGIALSAKLDKKNFYTYCLIGDMETTEGQIWEAAEIASHYKLNNLIAILDVNRIGQSDETLHGWDVKKYAKKFESFGWNTITIDGHHIVQIANAFNLAKKNKYPTIIIAKTVKGYGIRSIENKLGYHGKAIEKKKLPSILKELFMRFKEISKYNQNYQWHPKIGKETKIVKYPNQFKLEKPNFDKNEKVATRKAYGIALEKLAEVCPQLLSLDAEVKNSTFAEILEKKFPQKFIQCFIAEQNMISMAVGLTTRNKITFSSTFSCFLTRAFDQLRLAAISQSPLRICGSHSGVSIGQDGPSQMGLEDIAMIRTLPNSIIFYPSDAVSTYKLVELMANINDGISYLRTTRPETPIIYSNDENFKISGCKILKQSSNDQICVIAAGITLHEALKAYEYLKKENIFISIIDLYCVKPIDVKTILNLAKKSNNKILTVEDHYLQGGIGEAITFELKNTKLKIKCLAVTKLPRSGTPEKLLRFEKIDKESILNVVKKMI